MPIRLTRTVSRPSSAFLLSLLASGLAHAGSTEFSLPRPAALSDIQIRVLQPDGPAPASGWPVVYFLDGDLVFDALEADGINPSDLVLVGIGYDLPRPERQTARTRDYTPASTEPAHLVDGVPRAGGGADDFLAFLTTTALPAVAQIAPIDPERQTLAGHSLGGLFALHAALQPSSPFQQVVAASPSLWWDDSMMLAQSSAYTPNGTPLPVTLLIGSEEAKSTGQGKGRTAHLTGGERIQQLAATLQALPGSQVTLEIFPGLGHGPMRPAMIAPALAAARAGANSGANSGAQARATQ